MHTNTYIYTSIHLYMHTYTYIYTYILNEVRALVSRISALSLWMAPLPRVEGQQRGGEHQERSIPWTMMEIRVAVGPAQSLQQDHSGSDGEHEELQLHPRWPPPSGSQMVDCLFHHAWLLFCMPRRSRRTRCPDRCR
jgi:hypothetical protein